MDEIYSVIYIERLHPRIDWQRRPYWRRRQRSPRDKPEPDENPERKYPELVYEIEY